MKEVKQIEKAINRPEMEQEMFEIIEPLSRWVSSPLQKRLCGFSFDDEQCHLKFDRRSVEEIINAIKRLDEMRRKFC